MNNLYHKVAIASVCTALSFTLGANKEAKAATFTLTMDSSGTSDGMSFIVWDTDQDGLGNNVYGGAVSHPVGIRRGEGFVEEYRTFYEFNIAQLSLGSNTVISSAIFQGASNSPVGGEGTMALFGYVGNYQPDLSDFARETYYIPSRPSDFPNGTFSYDVTSFIQQIISNNAFAGFGARSAYLEDPFYVELNRFANLTITTVDVAEPVPEPTTIFGSAIALGVGGWLKRKKLSQQNKITSQH
jgi:hypothetical protein